MRRIRKYIAILLVFAGLYGIGWLFFYREAPIDPSKFPTEPTTGTAATFSELKRQIPLHEATRHLPEIGPYHWEGPYDFEDGAECSDQYYIRGKVKDPQWIARLRELGLLTEDFSPDNVTSLGTFSTTGYSMTIFSDGSFEIDQCDYYGDYDGEGY